MTVSPFLRKLRIGPLGIAHVFSVRASVELHGKEPRIKFAYTCLDQCFAVRAYAHVRGYRRRNKSAIVRRTSATAWLLSVPLQRRDVSAVQEVCLQHQGFFCDLLYVYSAYLEEQQRPGPDWPLDPMP